MPRQTGVGEIRVEAADGTEDGGKVKICQCGCNGDCQNCPCKKGKKK